jgi:hypothetical protein
MNERIKELIIKARLSYVMTPDKPYIEEDLEKFAQLIIAHATECVRDVLRDEKSDLNYAAAGRVQERIKQYFGVEY